MFLRARLLLLLLQRRLSRGAGLFNNGPTGRFGVETCSSGRALKFDKGGCRAVVLSK